MQKGFKETGTLIVKESLSILLAIFIAIAAFVIFFAIYFKPSDLGIVFWVILFILVFLAAGIGIKLLTLKPIMQVDKHGILFFKSGMHIKWNRFGKASLREIPKDNDETDEVLTIYYYIPNVAQLQSIDVKMGMLYDKSAMEIFEAIDYFRKNKVN